MTRWLLAGGLAATLVGVALSFAAVVAWLESGSLTPLAIGVVRELHGRVRGRSLERKEPLVI